jgi:hypothetical protein
VTVLCYLAESLLDTLCDIFQTESACVALVDYPDKVFFWSGRGICTPRTYAQWAMPFLTTTLATSINRVVIIEDAQTDARRAHAPLLGAYDGSTSTYAQLAMTCMSWGFCCEQGEGLPDCERRRAVLLWGAPRGGQRHQDWLPVSTLAPRYPMHAWQQGTYRALLCYCQKHQHLCGHACGAGARLAGSPASRTPCWHLCWTGWRS